MNLRFLLLSLLFPLSAFCADVAKPAPVAAPAAPAAASAPSQKYDLQRKSSFNIPKETRAPFWPIGWTPNNAAPVLVTQPNAQPAQVKLDAKSFKVTSILLGNPSLAVVNSRSYAEGDMLRSPKGYTGPRIRITRISDGEVLLQCLDQSLAIPLQREQLKEAKPADVEEADFTGQ